MFYYVLCCSDHFPIVHFFPSSMWIPVFSSLFFIFSLSITFLHSFLLFMGSIMFCCLLFLVSVLFCSSFYCILFLFSWQTTHSVHLNDALRCILLLRTFVSVFVFICVCVFSLGGGLQEGGVSCRPEIRGSDQQCKQEVSINCGYAWRCSITCLLRQH